MHIEMLRLQNKLNLKDVKMHVSSVKAKNRPQRCVHFNFWAIINEVAQLLPCIKYIQRNIIYILVFWHQHLGAKALQGERSKKAQATFLECQWDILQFQNKG